MRKNFLPLLIVLSALALLLGEARPSRSSEHISTPPIPFSISGLVKFKGFYLAADDPVFAHCGLFSFGPAWIQIIEGQSYYSMDILGDDPETKDSKEGCYIGETVTFTIKGDAAEQTTEWQSALFELDLSFGSPNLVFLPMVRR